jgi:DNA repair exonuclease SbcCD ATPase subunit
MKIPISAIIAGLLLVGVSLSAQVTEPPPPQPTNQIPGAPASAPTAEQQSDLQGDLFGARLDNVKGLRAAYFAEHERSMKVIDGLALTKKCQDKRVSGILQRTIALMNKYYEAEKSYWQAWNERESIRLEGQFKSLASMEEEQQQTGALIEDAKKARVKLERERSDLANVRQTDEIKAEMDRLVKEIRDSEAKLASLQEQYDTLTEKLKGLKGDLQTKIAQIHRYQNELEEWKVMTLEIYWAKSTAAEAVCNMKQPGSRTPLPKNVAQ